MSIFHDALQTGKHSCYLRSDCMLPMMYIDDCIKSLHEMMIAPEENLSTRVYNVAGMSFTPDILYNEVKKHVPNLAIEYNIDDRQKIGKYFLLYFISFLLVSLIIRVAKVVADHDDLLTY